MVMKKKGYIMFIASQNAIRNISTQRLKTMHLYVAKVTENIKTIDITTFIEIIDFLLINYKRLYLSSLLSSTWQNTVKKI